MSHPANIVLILHHMDEAKDEAKDEVEVEDVEVKDVEVEDVDDVEVDTIGVRKLEVAARAEESGYLSERKAGIILAKADMASVAAGAPLLICHSYDS